MSRDSPTHKQRPQPRFMYSTEASRASKIRKSSPVRRPAAPLSSPISKRQHLFQRAAQRLTSLSASKTSRLPLSSPASIRLSSPSRRVSHLPGPVKKAPVESPSDKPLPSLPVATFVSRSAIQRRSLIDAAEKPLRRSISPGVLQDWPALSPLKAAELEAARGNTSIMVKESTTVKSSLGESVIERMRKLNLEDGTVSKGRPQDYTHKVVSHTYQRADAGSQHSDAKFLDPRPAPETPKAKKEDRTSSGSSIGRRSSLRDLSVQKVRSTRSKVQQPDAIKDVGTSDAKPPELSRQNVEGDIMYSRPATHKLKRMSGSHIPIFRGVLSTGSPNVNRSELLPKVVQLKYSRGQISPHVESSDLETALPSAKRNSSLPLLNSNMAVSPTTSVRASAIMSTWMQPDLCEREASQRSSDTTIKLEIPSSPASMKSGKEYSPGSKENEPPNSPSADEELSPVRNFRFPVTVPTEDDNDDNRSDMTRVTSVSSMSKAGTVYAHDEYGGYRLKPVSRADPKHGPRVRIEDSADRLLLDDEHLAKVEAKHEIYKQKYNRQNGDDNNIVPELKSFRSPGEGNQVPGESRIGSTVTATDSGPQQQQSKQSSMGGHKLAPPVPINIPTLAHSPTGWPLMISKIAPFAEVETNRNISVSSRRKSASESNLRGPPGTPGQNAPEVVQSSPPSAYTLRTALHDLPIGNGPGPEIHTKPQKSMPELASRPLFPPRRSSKIDAIPVTDAFKHGLRKQTSDLLHSFVNQRAHFKGTEFQTNDSMITTNDHESHAHPQKDHDTTITLTPSPPKHMRSFNASTRHVNAQQDIDAGLPSSPLPIPGSVPSGKPKMMSKIGSLFHKSSKDGTLARSGSTASAIHKSTSTLSPRTNTATSSTNSSRRRSAITTNGLTSPAGAAYKPSPFSSPLIRSGSVSSARPSAIYHGAVNETSTPPMNAAKRKLFGRGHKHNATHPQTDTSEKRNMSPQFMTSALEPLEFRDATTLAFALLDRARAAKASGSLRSNLNGPTTNGQTEQVQTTSSMAQEDFVELGKVILGVVSMARDAEKAKEEAKAAAARAEIESVKTRRAVAELCDSLRDLVDAIGGH